MRPPTFVVVKADVVSIACDSVLNPGATLFDSGYASSEPFDDRDACLDLPGKSDLGVQSAVVATVGPVRTLNGVLRSNNDACCASPPVDRIVRVNRI